MYCSTVSLFALFRLTPAGYEIPFFFLSAGRLPGSRALRLIWGLMMTLLWLTGLQTTDIPYSRAVIAHIMGSVNVSVPDLCYLRHAPP